MKAYIHGMPLLPLIEYCPYEAGLYALSCGISIEAIVEFINKEIFYIEYLDPNNNLPVSINNLAQELAFDNYQYRDFTNYFVGIINEIESSKISSSMTTLCLMGDIHTKTITTNLIHCLDDSDRDLICHLINCVFNPSELQEIYNPITMNIVINHAKLVMICIGNGIVTYCLRIIAVLMKYQQQLKDKIFSNTSQYAFRNKVNLIVRVLIDAHRFQSLSNKTIQSYISQLRNILVNAKSILKRDEYIDLVIYESACNVLSDADIKLESLFNDIIGKLDISINTDNIHKVLIEELWQTLIEICSVSNITIIDKLDKNYHDTFSTITDNVLSYFHREIDKIKVNPSRYKKGIDNIQLIKVIASYDKN